jgi:hypothetical protein
MGNLTTGEVICGQYVPIIHSFLMIHDVCAPCNGIVVVKLTLPKLLNFWLGVAPEGSAERFFLGGWGGWKDNNRVLSHFNSVYVFTLS